MILDGYLGQIVAGFVEAQKLGVTLQGYIAEWKVAHPEFGTTKKALIEAFESVRGEAFEWLYTRDQVALSEMLKTHTPEQIKAKWLAGLASTDPYKRPDNVGQLRSKWNGIVVAEQRKPKATYF